MSSTSENQFKETVAVALPVVNTNPSPRSVPIVANKNKVTYVSPGILDSEGFLAPPPASTLLIRRTRTNSSGSSTYVVASPTPASSESNDNEPKPCNNNFDASTSFDRINETAVDTPITPGLNEGKEKQNLTLTPLESLGNHVENVTSSSSSSFSSAINPVPQSYVSKGKPQIVSALNSSIPGAGVAGVKKRGPRGKYKERKKINIDILTGKRRYTRKKIFASQRKSKCVEIVPPEKSEDEYESADSEDGKAAPNLSDNGVWRPTDDLRLIANTIQTCNLKHVYIGVKFSCKFTMDDITSRWRTLLYDKKASHVAQTAINNLHPLVKDRIYSDVLFSDKEEDLLKTVNESTKGHPDLRTFQRLLDEHWETFFKTRTPQTLFNHWLGLRELNMLKAQKGKRVCERFETFELSVDDMELMKETFDKSVMQELVVVARNNRKKIRMVEKEIKNLQRIVDNIILKDTIVKPEAISNFATLRGRQVQYLMRSQEITFGRRTTHNFVDADIQLEGSASQVSRLQGKIILDDCGQFYIYNYGRNNIIVNSRPLFPYSKTRIADQAIILICKLSFIFEVNKEVVHFIRKMHDNKKSLPIIKKADSENQCEPKIETKTEEPVANSNSNEESVSKQPNAVSQQSL